MGEDKSWNRLRRRDPHGLITWVKMDNEQKQPSVQKKDSDAVFLRTLLKKSVHDRLKAFALRYSTGRGDWDYGVAIEVLLDNYEQSQLSSLNEKIEFIASILADKLEENVKQVEKEEDFIEMLGGEKISKR